MVLQLPGGVELLVIGLIFLLPVLVIGAIVYLVYSAGGRSGGRERSQGKSRVDTPANGGEDTDTVTHEASETKHSETDLETERVRPEQPQSIRRLIDFIVAASLFLAGFAGAVTGTTIYFLADRERISQLVEDGVIQSDVLSDAALVDLSHIFMVWGGLGTVVAGLLAILAGVAFAGARIHSAPESDGTSAPSLVSNSLLGAVVTVVLSFIPVSAVIGGGVAGYFQRSGPLAGLQAGLLAGVIVALPLLIILGTFALGLFSAGLVVVGTVVLVGLFLALLYSVGLSAIGGYVGGYLVRRN